MTQSSVVQPTMPSIYMDPVNQQAILQAAQRTGWIASQPVPDVAVQVDNITGQPTTTIKGWKMAVSDPKTGQNDTLNLSYSPGGKQPWTYAGGAGDLKTPTAQKTPQDQVQAVGGVLYQPDPKNPNGPWIAVTDQQGAKDKADADLKKTLADANYTDEQIAALKAKSDPEIKQVLAQSGLYGAQADQIVNNIKIANATLEGTIAKTAADTDYTKQQTTNLQQATDLAKAKAPFENELLRQQAAAQQATAAGTEASTERTNQQIKQGNAPTIAEPGTGMYAYTRDPNTGQLTPSYNANFTAKTQADVAGRVGQLQSMAQAQRDQISTDLQSGKYGTGPDAQQKAAAAFDQWWSQTVEPQKAQLAAAQQQAQLDQQKAQQEQARANLATAQTSAGEIMRAAQASAPPGNSPAYAAALGGILKGTKGAPQGVDYAAALSAPAPDYNKIYEQATAQALAHISPTAAQIATGQPVPTALGQIQNADIGGQLNRTNYDAFGNPAAAPAAPAPAPAPAPVAPVGGPTNPTMNIAAMPGSTGLLTGPSQSTPLPFSGGYQPWNPYWQQSNYVPGG